MKKIINGLFAITVFATAANAQTDSTVSRSAAQPTGITSTTNSGQGGMRQTSLDDPMSNWYTVDQYYDRMDANTVNSYKLTDQQRAQMQTINTDYDARVKSAYNDKTMTSNQMRYNWQTMRDARRRAYLNTLSPADRTSYQAYINDWNNYNVDMDEMKVNLALTDAQYAKLNELNNSYRQKEMTIINTQGLSDDEKNKQLRTVYDDRAGIYKSILSADQITKLQHKDNGTWKIKTQTGDQKTKIKTKPVKSNMQ
jgi:hypothetical protein